MISEGNDVGGVLRITVSYEALPCGRAVGKSWRGGSVMSRKSFFLLVPLAAVFFWLAWAAVLVRAEERVSLVKDLNPIKGVDNLALTGAGDFFYFQNYDPVHGVELWECDGTLPGMRVVKDIRSGPGSSFPDNFTPADSLLYFTAEDGVHGRELWRTDGTESGTILLRDIVPGIASPKFTQFVAAGRMLYFLADDGTSGTQLWRSDGSPEGTSSLRSIKPKWWQSVDAIFPPVGSNVFFRTVVGQGQGEMWRTDGTTTGTARVLSQYITHPEWSAAAGGNLLFWVRDPADTSGYRWDLWLSDGTASGTGLLKSMGLSQTMVIQYPICTATIGPKAFFAVDDIYGGAELWRSDGTASGTLLVKQEIVPVSQMVSCGSRLFFTGSHDYYYEAELWVTDGTSSGTHQVLTRDSPESQIYLPSRLTPVGSSLFFFFDDGFHGCELWESDGTSTGTRVVKDISTGNSESVDPSDTRPTRMPVLGRTVFFSADDGVHSNALWCSDGTETGTAMLADVFNGSRSSTLSPYTVGGDSSVYVSSQETAPNPSTWRSDGTATGTVRLNGLLPSLASSEIRVMGSLGPVFLFFTHEWENTWTLWKSDGTTTGTESLKTCAGTNTQIY
jgi:ELWxxDGT repeat protein